MRLERVEPGDVVCCAIKGRTGIWGEVTEIKDGVVGGDASKVRFSEAVRPRTGQQVPVCERCQGKYSPDQFPEGVIFKGK